MFISRRALGIDIHDNLIQAVLLEKRGHEIRLISFNQISILSHVISGGVIQNKERLTEAVQELLATSNPSSIKTGYFTSCSIPETQIFTHLFEFPRRLNEEEVKRTIPFEAEKIVPFPTEQIYWDMQSVLEDEQTAQRLTNNFIYAAVPRQLADCYFELLETAGISPFVFSLEADGLVRSLLSNEDKEKGGILILDIGSTITTCTIYDVKSIQNTINIALSAIDLYEKIGKCLQIRTEEAIELHKQGGLQNKKCVKAVEVEIKKLCQRTSEIIHEYEENNPHKIQKVILCGSYLDIPGILLYAMQNLQKKVEIGNPWKSIKIVHKDFDPLASDTELAKTKAVAFSTAIGLALRGLDKNPSAGINLVPDKVKVTIAKKKINHIGNLLGITLIVAVCVNIFAFGVIWGKFHYEAKILAREGENISQITSSTRYMELKNAILAFNQEVVEVEKIQIKTFSVPQILQEILNNIPENVEPTSLSVNHDALSVSFSGIAPDREDIIKIKERLEKSSYVTEVVSPLKNFDKKTNISFEIIINLNKISMPLFGSSAQGSEEAKDIIKGLRKKQPF